MRFLHSYGCMEKKRNRVKIKENSWLAKRAAAHLGYTEVAMVVGHTIHLYNTTVAQFFARPSWVIHELKHVEQYEQNGLIGFLWKYLWDYRKNGYWNNKFEVEARAAESDLLLLQQYDLDKYLPVKS